MRSELPMQLAVDAFAERVRVDEVVLAVGQVDEKVDDEAEAHGRPGEEQHVVAGRVL